MIYPDTSFLFSLYIQEEVSLIARAYGRQLDAPLLYTPFHRLELRTALRLRAFRQEISLEDLKAALRESDADVALGSLQHTPLDWHATLREAEELGDAHLTDIGVRSGDLFHVAAAVVLGATVFVTFDQRQTVLAKRAGLKVKTWKVV